MPRRNKEDTGRPLTTDDERREDKREEDGGKKNEDEEEQNVSKTTKKRKRIKEDKDSGTRNHQGMKRKKGEEKEEKEQEKEKTDEEGDDTDNKTEVAGMDGGEYKEDGDDREAKIHSTWRDTTENHEQGLEGDDEEGNLPTTPEKAARDYQNYRNNLIPPSIKQQRRDAIRKHKQAAQYPINYRGQQLFPPDFDQHGPLQPNTQTRKYRQLTAQTSEIRKDIREDSP